MVSINSSFVKYPKLTFGAHDNESNPKMAFSPAEISNNPYGDNHGSKFQNHNGLLSGISPKSTNLIPEYDYYGDPESKNAHHGHSSNKSGIIKTLLVLAGLTAAGVYAYKKRKNILNLFKKKSNTNTASQTAPTPKKFAKNLEREIDTQKISTADFKNYYNDVTTKAHIDENLDAIEMKNIQVIMNNKVHSVADKKKHLQNLYEIGQIYNHKDQQSRIILIMPESMAENADYVVSMFAKNRIDEVPDKMIEKIEGFKLLNVERHWADKHDMIVDSQVRHGINAKEADEVANKWGRNIHNFFRKLF